MSMNLGFRKINSNKKEKKMSSKKVEIEISVRITLGVNSRLRQERLSWPEFFWSAVQKLSVKHYRRFFSFAWFLALERYRLHLRGFVDISYCTWSNWILNWILICNLPVWILMCLFQVDLSYKVLLHIGHSFRSLGFPIFADAIFCM